MTAAVTHAHDADAALPPIVRDTHSFAQPHNVIVRHISLDLTADFTARQLAGHAILTYERTKQSAPNAPLIVDTEGLIIESVTRVTTPSATANDKAPEEKLNYVLDAALPVLGSRLSIDIPKDAVTGQVRIRYRTGPDASALQWLEPPATAGGKKPFLFTQSQAIHARSWLPLQDTPGVRITYDARITVPADLTAVMSAEMFPPEPAPAKDAHKKIPMRTFRFRMPQAIPSYLIALAVGELEFRELGPRSGVYAEPSVVAMAAEEFEDIEAMIRDTEKHFGPYRWGRYDVLVLPPSFPYGGMENPRLTFATPTILAGDRSLVALIIHELAHSWSGNLVTNATWRDFWLNEGFTVYLERRVLESLYGKTRAGMEAVLGMSDLREDLESLQPRDQILHINLDGRDPEEGTTNIPYEKGALFLTALEHAYGREQFDVFLKNYFDQFAFQSITTEQFLAYLDKHLISKDREALTRNGIDLKIWLENPGLPERHPTPASDRFGLVDAERTAWLTGKKTASDLPVKEWTTHEWLHFLDGMPKDLSIGQLTALDKAFGLTSRGNAEIAQHWLVIAVRARYAPAYPRLEQFLSAIGRRKFLMPLYTELLKTPEGRTRAETIYAKARNAYHPIARDSVDKLFQKGQ